MKILTCKQMRNLEQTYVDNSDVGYYDLMKNAGTIAAKLFIKEYNIKKGDTITVVCGKGNNGGDGIVAAKYFNQIGINAEVILVDGEIKTSEALTALEEAEKNNVPVLRIWQKPGMAMEKIKNSDYIIDAIYGIGFRGSIRDDILPVVEFINKSRGRVMAIDLPSGASCDSGNIENGCVKADITASFTTLKPVHVLYPSMDYCGKTTVLDVGISQPLIDTSPSWAETVSQTSINSALTKRNISSNKGTFGTLLAICGSYGMPGAAQLAARGAYTCGVGLVKAAVTHSVYVLVSPTFPEAVYIPLKENNNGRIATENIDFILSQINTSSAVLLGCGMGIDDDTKTLVFEIIKQCTVPLVLDADALNIVAKQPDILNHAKTKIIITPHPGEMSRLCGISIDEVQRNRKECAKLFSEKYNVITILKGAYTVIASEHGKCLINTNGNTGMARGGSGDVLAGIIAGLLAQGSSPFDAACAGVYIHGGAGDLCRKKLGEYSTLASDIIRAVPEFLNFSLEKTEISTNLTDDSRCRPKTPTSL